MDYNSFGWIYLAIFLFVLLLIMTIFYSYIVATRIPPSLCPMSIGDYGVLGNVTGNILNECNGPCTFIVPSINAALDRCNIDSSICRAFYYDGIRMSYVDPSNPVTANGAMFVRQVGLTN